MYSSVLCGGLRTHSTMYTKLTAQTGVALVPPLARDPCQRRLKATGANMMTLIIRAVWEMMRLALVCWSQSMGDMPWPLPVSDAAGLCTYYIVVSSVVD